MFQPTDPTPLVTPADYYRADAKAHRDAAAAALGNPDLLARGLGLVDRIVSFHEREALIDDAKAFGLEMAAVA